MSSKSNNFLSNYWKFINLLVPKPVQPPLIGIDIGTSAIKAVVLNPAGDGLELTAWDIQKIEGDDVKTALKDLLNRVKSANHVLVSSVSGKGTMIRYIDLPRMSLEDLRKSFLFEIDKYFPFDPQSIYIDCFILDPKSKNKRMQVLVAAVKKEIIDERIKLFKDVGVEAGRVTLNSIATANAFERLGPPVTSTENAKAVLDIGGSISNLSIMKEGVPCFTRDIFIGSQEMTKQIVNILGVDAAQAEALKCAPGGRSAEIMEACEAAVAQLVAELRLSLDYFITEKNMQVDEFFLLGGGAMFKGIEEVFTKDLGMSVKFWDLMVNLRVHPSLPLADVRASCSRLGVAVGLGLSKND